MGWCPRFATSMSDFNLENNEGGKNLSSFYIFRFFNIQKDNPNAEWAVPDDKVLIASGPNEVVVAGVYLRLFVANPGWAVRRPKEFLNELMETCLSLMNKEKTDVSDFFPLCLLVRLLFLFFSF